MKKNYLLFATAAIVLAGCTADDDLSAGKSTSPAQGDGAIMFSMNTPATTRTNQLSGDDAATALGNMFIVWGEKNEDANAATSANGKLVFENYVVKHDVTDATGSGTTTSNYTANSTTSNTNGWEYVGIDHSFIHNTNEGETDYVTSNIGSDKAQTIKYWDDNASSYTFTAVSALSTDISIGNVTIAKTTSSSDVYGKGYTINVKSGASTGNIYYADRHSFTKPTGGYTHDVVTLNFRHFESKIRFGIYETVPGYKVLITNVKYNNDAEHTTTSNNNGADKFGVDGAFVIAGDNTAYTVTYENASSSNPNKVKVAATGKNTQAYFAGGTNILAQTSNIGTTASAPTWDIANGGYTAILPNPDNATNMKLKISYTLISEDTGEKIEVTDKTAEVPAAYCQWKSNYAYSYIFKISDKSTSLYPITFDAVVVTDEIGNQETITTVSEPSITTFATTSDGKSYKTKGNEYVKDDVIYATVVEGSSLVNLTTNNIQLYTVTTTDATNYPITEASVAHALKQTNVTTNITATKFNTSGITDANLVNEVPTEDGKTIKLDNTSGSTNKRALTWTAADATVYAIEYINGENKTYKIVKINNANGQKTNP